MIENAVRTKLEAVFRGASNSGEIYVPLFLAKGELQDRHYYIHPANIRLDVFRSMLAVNDRLTIFIPDDFEQLSSILKEVDTYENCYFANTSSFWELDDLKENEYGIIAVNSDLDIYKIIFKQYANNLPYFIKSAFYKFNLEMDRTFIKKLLAFNDKCFEPARKRIAAFDTLDVFVRLRQNFIEITQSGI